MLLLSIFRSSMNQVAGNNLVHHLNSSIMPIIRKVCLLDANKKIVGHDWFLFGFKIFETKFVNTHVWTSE